MTDILAPQTHQHETGTMLDSATSDAVPLTRLLTVGMRLAVYGVDDSPGGDRRWWHVVRPGTMGHLDLKTRLRYGTSLCRIYVATNGYSADFNPLRALCPACAELL